MNYAPLLALLFAAWGVLFGGLLWTWLIFRRRWPDGWRLNFLGCVLGALAAQAIGLEFATTGEWYRHLAWPAAGAVVAAVAGKDAVPASLPPLLFAAVIGFEVSERSVEILLIVLLPATALALSQFKPFPLRALVAVVAVALPYTLSSQGRQQNRRSEQEIYRATLSKALEEGPLAKAFAVPLKVEWGEIEFPEDAWGKPVCRGTTPSGFVVQLNKYGIVTVDFRLSTPLKMSAGKNELNRTVDPFSLKKNGLNPSLFQSVTAGLPPGRKESPPELGSPAKAFCLHRNGNVVAILYLGPAAARVELLGRADIQDGSAVWIPVYETGK